MGQLGMRSHGSCLAGLASKQGQFLHEFLFAHPCSTALGPQFLHNFMRDLDISNSMYMQIDLDHCNPYLKPQSK